MMYLQVVRRNPISDWNPFIYEHWIIGKLTDQQMRWIKKFSHRTRGNITGEISLKWALFGSVSFLALLGLQVSIPNAFLAAGAVTLTSFGLHLRSALHAWKRAASYVRSRELVVCRGEASWSAARGVITGNLESSETSAVVDFFHNVIEHDKLMRNRNLEWNDRMRIQNDLAARVEVLEAELIRRRELSQIMQTTHAEYADKAAILDKVTVEERRQKLHERVSEALNQPH